MSLVRNSIQYFTAVKLWKIHLIRHTVVTHLTENITYEKYVQVSHTYNSPKCVTCNTSDQIYLACDKFDRKLPCCKINSTELFITVTYLTKYMLCEKSDRISHTYISPKIFPFIKNLFTGVQAIEILMCDKLVWVKNSKSAKRILHLCPNVKNSVEFITPAWGIRSVRNTVQQSCLAVKIMSIVPLSFLNPRRISDRSPDCLRCSFNRFSRTLAIKRCLDECRKLENSLSFWIGR